jgi:FkbH-like protein
MKKIAILSNINIEPVVKGLSTERTVFSGEGYGNELEMLLNPSSSLRLYRPEVVVLVIDLLELIGHRWHREEAVEAIDKWFATLSASLTDSCIYFIPDVCLRGKEWQIYSLVEPDFETALQQHWQSLRLQLIQEHNNVYAWSYERVIKEMSQQEAYSDKMWYLGKMIHSRKAFQSLQKEISHLIDTLDVTPKKLLLLDLDNTLWGGLAGEYPGRQIQLSEEKTGMVYKDLQRVIQVMQAAGVMFGIVSKNNPEDALAIIRNHPHMILREKDFVAMRINWHPKSDNIREIAAELNIGLDSIVFFDDNVLEREEVKQLLPEVIVPDFPEQTDKLPQTMYDIWQRYFFRVVVTREDLAKTEQYHEEQARKHLQETDYAKDFAGYLENLDIRMERIAAESCVERITQLLNKTNQFNVTTKRYELSQVTSQIAQHQKTYYAYRVSDRFGDVGIVGVVGVVFEKEAARIEDFVMSCRIMGRLVEYAILEDVEREIQAKGCLEVWAQYIPTAKNKPVETFWDNAGYRLVEEKDGIKEYKVCLEQLPQREYYVRRLHEER